MKNSHALSLSLIIFAALVFAQLYGSITQNDGHFVYPLDDPYIHMTIARNVAAGNGWGINAGEFSSGSSSVLFVLLNAFLIKIFGDFIWMPLFINWTAGLFTVAFLHWIFRRAGFTPFYNFAAVFILVLLIPLNILALMGMEHTIHVAASLVFLYFAACRIAGDTIFDRRGDLLALLSSAFILGLIRYESLFMFCLAVPALLIVRKFPDALMTAVAGIAPMTVFGFFAIASGGSFFPNPVLLKGMMGVVNAGNYPLVWLAGKLKLMFHTPFIFALMIVLLLTLDWLLGREEGGDFRIFFVLIAFMTVVLHTFFAALGWFARYEAYLIAAGLTGVLLAAGPFCAAFRNMKFIRKISLAVISLTLLYPMISRGYTSNVQYGTATANIYGQQCQLARFVGLYYNDRCVAVNDVGTVSYFTKARILDLYGLASNDVTGYRMSGSYTSSEISLLCRKYRPGVAMIYDKWFYNLIPAGWTKVGEWEIQDNVVCGSPRVSFFSLDTDETRNLINYFKEFSGKLPEGVTSELIYR